jgi:two-component system chemotaxis response regulator CheB
VNATRKIRVLIVDDSAVVRQALAEVLSSDPGISVIGTAPDPFVAAEKIRLEVPDVITLDVEMPRMDGLTFLRKIMTQHPMPVVICSSLTEAGAVTTLRALEYGAVDIILKPRLGARQFLEENRIRLLDAVKAAAHARVAKILVRTDRVAPKLTADAVLKKAAPDSLIHTTEKVVVVGASTGGTEAIRELLEDLPIDSPGMVIVQHMPEHFTKAFAQRLDGICQVAVKEAQQNDSIVRGMLELKEAGALTIAQDEASCVVFGMPKEAIKKGGVDRVLPLAAIPAQLRRAGS